MSAKYKIIVSILALTNDNSVNASPPSLATAARATPKHYLPFFPDWFAKYLKRLDIIKKIKYYIVGEFMKPILIIIVVFLLMACNIYKKENLEKEALNRNDNIKENMAGEEYLEIINEVLIEIINMRIQMMPFEELSNEKKANCEQVTRFLIEMPPERAVSILVSIDDHDLINILQSVNKIVQEHDASAIVNYWLSLMDRTRLLQLAGLQSEPIDQSIDKEKPLLIELEQSIR